MTAPKQVSHLVLPGWSSAMRAGPGGAPGKRLSSMSAAHPTASTSSIPATRRHPFLVDRGGEPNPIPTGRPAAFASVPSLRWAISWSPAPTTGAAMPHSTSATPSTRYCWTRWCGTGRPRIAPCSTAACLYAIGTDDDLHGLDVHDPTDIRRLDSVAVFGRGGYLTVQDNFVHAGASDHYVKVDISDPGEYRSSARRRPVCRTTTKISPSPRQFDRA